MTGLYTGSKTVDPTGNRMIDGVLWGMAWDGFITYAFPTRPGDYSYSAEPANNFSAVSVSQKQEALFFLEQSNGTGADDGFAVEGFTLASFGSGDATTATIRFAGSDEAKPTAYAYYPAMGDDAGDIWFGSAYAGTDLDYRKPVVGNYAWHVLIHELGHALGLKHGHETDGNPPLPASVDSFEYSVMTYRTYIGGGTEDGNQYDAGSAPQTFMMSDIAALQHMYGADYATLGGDTAYRWTPGSGQTVIDGKVTLDPGSNTIFATLWDGGGSDTYDLTAYRTALSIDLRPGNFSVFSKQQSAYLGGGPNDGYARGNIFNALLYHGDTRSLIENVMAGSGNDKLAGNQADNAISGNGGNDAIYGFAGNDSLNGGAGADRLDGGTGIDTVSYAGSGAGVTVNLLKPSLNVGIAKGDTFVLVENVTGSGYNDRLTGNATANVLTGSLGADQLTGGGGADSFAFLAWTESKGTAMDTILDFSITQRDRIDLTAFDANTRQAGIQDIIFIGAKAFSGTAGELRASKLSSDTYLYADVNGDKTSDFVVHFDDALSLRAGYFLV